MVLKVLEDLKKVFQTSGPVVIFPSSGTGAWEAALVNTLSAGDKALMFETGYFATQWQEMARKLGLDVEFVSGSWRSGVDPEMVKTKLYEDKEHRIKSLMVVHNETSTGVTSRIAEIRKAIDNVGHPCLLMVDTISSLGCIEFRHEKWGVDVTVSCSQKGLMLPPGLGFNAISEKALVASRTSRLPKVYWDWEKMLALNQKGLFPYTPATNLLYGLKEALIMLEEEGLPNVFARHLRFAEATRKAVHAWGLEVLCLNSEEHSNSLTAVLMPEGYSADSLRKIILENYNMSLGNGLGKLTDKVFRIGHLGDFNELSLIGTLAGIEMGLALSGTPHQEGGVGVALKSLKADS
jgi:alanine-glyoxylate transaminase/serine-glyoxylate transaminase/serine-pyruvate transaminase